MRRLRALFSWDFAGPILGYVLVALLTVSVVEAFVARQEAYVARDRTATAAAHRIDGLLAQITVLEDRLRHVSTRDARERGRLEEAIQALTEQVRQAGGEPVVFVRQSPSPQPQPSRSPRPRPGPSPTPSPSHHPTPAPSPSPTCDLRHIPKCLPTL